MSKVVIGDTNVGVSAKSPISVVEVGGPPGPTGPSGSQWHDGSGVPSDSLGSDGDFYLNNDNGDVYEKQSGSYTLVANIQGPAGDGTGDMTKAVYDTNDDGAVNSADNADTVDGSHATDFATSAQGALADTAVQPNDDADTLGSGVASDGQVLTADGAGGSAWEAGGSGSGDMTKAVYDTNDDGTVDSADNADTVDGLNASDLATAAQGDLADTAVQPGDDVDVLGSGTSTDGQVLASDGAGNTVWKDGADLDDISMQFEGDGTGLWIATQSETLDLTNVLHLEADGTAGTGSLAYERDGASIADTFPSEFLSKEVLGVVRSGSSAPAAVSIPRYLTGSFTPNTQADIGQYSVSGFSTGPTETADYYVATDGSDTNDGSFGSPFATINHAASVVAPGDLVLIRGGTYNEQVLITTSGLSGSPITFAGYPGETVIHDGFTGTYNPDSTGRDQVFGWEVDASWIVIRDLTTTNANYMNLYVHDTNNIVRRVTSHSSRYHGFQLSGSDHLIEDCYAYDNQQPNGGYRSDQDTTQQSGDGFAFSGSNITARRCVARHNADDGFDAWGADGITIENCVSYDNGYDEGNGNGFKCSNDLDSTTTIRRCISFNNLRRGYTNNGGTGHTFYNNTAWAGPTGEQNVGFQNYDASVNVLRNNLAYEHGADDFDTLSSADPDHTYNTWNDPADAGGNDDFPITEPQFISTTRTDADFLALAGTSPCIDAGTDVGLTFTGTAPDLGALRDGETIEDLLGRPLDGV